MLTQQTIGATLDSYGLSASPSVYAKIASYIELLLRWNRRIPLTSIEGESEILRVLLVESIWGARVVPDLAGRVADVGAGAGFPGLALKIWRPDLELTLIESNMKKCTFLSEVARVLDLKDVEVFGGRFEDSPANWEKFRFITSRAMGDFSALLDWSGEFIESAGKMLIWTGTQGIKELQRARRWNWLESALIPNTKRRYIVVGVSAGASVGK